MTWKNSSRSVFDYILITRNKIVYDYLAGVAHFLQKLAPQNEISINNISFAIVSQLSLYIFKAS